MNESKRQFFKLQEMDPYDFRDETVSKLYVGGEEIIAYYKALRDYLLLTNKRIIVVDPKGVTGTRKNYTSFPFSKIQNFSFTSAGFMDIDSKIDLHFTFGSVHLEFTRNTDGFKIMRVIGEFIL